jgi:hypothetical protein
MFGGFAMDTPTAILVTGDTREVAGWVWHNLVPKSGQCGTVQGELLRAVEKLSWEAQNNGNVNWDAGFEILLDFREGTLCGEPGIADGMKEAIRADSGTLRNYEYPCTEQAPYDRLITLAKASIGRT